MIKVGDKLPAGKLQEFIEVEGNGCSIGPNTFDIGDATAGKTMQSSVCPVRTPPPVRPNMCRVMWSMHKP